MRRAGKNFFLLLVMAALLLFPGAQVCAASGKAPEDVRWVHVRAVSETSLKLSWRKASKADGYLVYLVDNKTKKKKCVAKTGKNEYIFQNLKPNQKYAYVIYAYRNVKSGRVKSENPSPTATLYLRAVVPAAPKDVEVVGYRDLKISLKWKPSKKADGYYVYRYDSGKKKFVRVATVTGCSYISSKLKADKKYRYVIKSFRKTGNYTVASVPSQEASATAKRLSAAATKVNGRSYYARVRSTTKGTVLLTGKTIVLKSGTGVTAVGRSGKYVSVVLSNGTKVRVERSKLSYSGIKSVRMQYTKKQKEAFINEKRYSSSTDYLIWINHYTMTVSVFQGYAENWKLVRSAVAVIGAGGRTPTGVFRLCHRGYNYGGPVLYFTYSPSTGKGNAFHRRIDGNSWTMASLGCVRLADSDLNFLNSHCPMGTTVVSY